MKAVLQRVTRAEVRIEGESVGRIGRGLVILVGFRPGDDDSEIDWMARKITQLRVFEDADGKMNRSVADIGGELLIVSQFTLYGDVGKGRRPSFVGAAVAEEARALYDRFVDRCRKGTVPVATGRFGAMMRVELVNDGPVTFVIER